MRDLLNVESAERVDLRDFRVAVDESQQDAHREVMGQFILDPNASSIYKILEGFAISNPSGKQLKVTKGKAILGQREGAIVKSATLTTEGDADKIVDMTAFSLGTYGIYLRFELVDGNNEVRSFWDPSGGGSEFSQIISTRRLANWSLRVESSSPGGEYMYIGDVDQATMSITDKRDFLFEGSVDSSYASGWGTGNDRNSDRQQYGIMNLNTFISAMRQLFDDLRPTGGRWWEKRGIKATGTGSDIGVEGVGGPTDGTGVKGTGGGTAGKGIEGIGADNGAGAGADGVVGTGGTGSTTDGRGLVGTSSTNIGVEGTSTGSAGVKGTSQAAGVHGVGNSGGVGVKAQATGTGKGVEASSTSSPAVEGTATTGKGVHGKSTSGSGVVGESTNGASLELVPRSGDPGSAEKGKGYVETATGALHLANGTNYPSAITSLSAGNGTRTGTGQLLSVTIPANVLKAGSILRFRAGGVCDDAIDSTNIRYSIRLNGSVVIQTPDRTGADLTDIFLQADYHAKDATGDDLDLMGSGIGAIGLNVNLSASNTATMGVGVRYSGLSGVHDAILIDKTTSLTVELYVESSNASATHKGTHLSVDISD